MSDPYQPYQPYSQAGQQPGQPADQQPSPQGYPQPGYAQNDYAGPGQAQAGYPQPPQGAYPPSGGNPYGYAPEPPGKTMGIVGFVLAFVIAPAGIVVSAMALSESKKVGYPNVLGKWGLWLSIAFTAISVLYVVFFVLLLGFGLFGAATYTDYSSALTV